MVLLSTERLLLRGLEMRDAPALLALYGDPQVMRHWNHAPWTALSQAEAAVREAQEDYALRRSLHLVIEQRPGAASHLALAHPVARRQFAAPAGAALVGSCALYDFGRRPGAATLGYLLARQHWGRGYAGEALQALLHHGFGPLALQRIEAEVARQNMPSMSLLARLGFRHTGSAAAWQVGGQAQPVEAFSLRRCEYNTVHEE